VKVVAISQRVEVHSDRNERRDALDQRISAWLAAAGYLPVPVPNGLGAIGPAQNGNALHIWLTALKPAAFVLSGGNDIDEAIERDNTERQLLDHALENRLPVLVMCLGMQMMGIWAGAKLKLVQGHTRTRHALSGDISGEANSFHNYSLASCPPGFTVSATAEDGGIEAIRHKDFSWEGWMWHPEREPEFQVRDTQRVQELFGG